MNLADYFRKVSQPEEKNELKPETHGIRSKFCITKYSQTFIASSYVVLKREKVVRYNIPDEIMELVINKAPIGEWVTVDYIFDDETLLPIEVRISYREDRLEKIWSKDGIES